MFSVKNIFNGLFLMLKKLTIIDVKFYADVENSDYLAGIFTIPIIGILIGMFTIPFSILKLIYNPLFCSILIFTLYCILTKCFSIIESSKTFEFFFAKYVKDFIVVKSIYIFTICTMYIILFSVSNFSTIIITPLIGYCSLIIDILFVKRDKNNTLILKYCNKNHVYFTFLLLYFICILLNIKLCISACIVLVINMILLNIIETKIKIIPLSFEGTIIEISQLLFLIISYMLYLN